MHGRKPVLLYCLDMLGARVALVRLKAIMGKSLGIAAHERVTVDLRDNGRRRDGRAFPIAFHNVDLTCVEVLRVAIEQYRIERSAFRRKLLLDGRDGTQVRRAQGPRSSIS